MSFANRDGVIWFDGELVPWREAKVHVLTHTLHYGMGVFEGVRAYKTRDHGTCIFKLEEHTDRLFRSAHIMNMKPGFDKNILNDAQKCVVKENNLEEAYLRPMMFLGSEGMGLRADNLKVHTIVASWNWPSYMSPEAKEKGINFSPVFLRRLSDHEWWWRDEQSWFWRRLNWRSAITSSSC